jgi:hypothetical protein
MPNIPRPGDVVIHRQIHSPAVYILSRLDGAPQCSYKSYGEALAGATGFALQAHLDAWYTTDEVAFKRVAHHRPAPR